MKQIEEVEHSFSDPLPTPLLQCGRYRLDGELKVRAPGESGGSKRSVSSRVQDYVHVVEVILHLWCVGGYSSLIK